MRYLKITELKKDKIAYNLDLIDSFSKANKDMNKTFIDSDKDVVKKSKSMIL